MKIWYRYSWGCNHSFSNQSYSATEWEGFVISFQSSSCHIPHSHAIMIQSLSVQLVITMLQRAAVTWLWFLILPAICHGSPPLFLSACASETLHPAQSHSTFAPAPAVEPCPLALPCHTLSCSSYHWPDYLGLSPLPAEELTPHGPGATMAIGTTGLQLLSNAVMRCHTLWLHHLMMDVWSNCCQNLRTACRKI